MTYEKALIRLYSWPILPPWSTACFFAAATCSGVASGLQVTYWAVSNAVRGTRHLRCRGGVYNYDVGRHGVGYSLVD